MAKFRVTNTAKFKYRYQCENCGNQTDWIYAIYSASTDVDSGFMGGKTAATNAENSKFWSDYSAMQQRANEGNYSGISLNGKCSSCGSRQSWERDKGSAASIIGGSMVSMLFGIALLNFFTVGTGSLGQLARLVIGWILVAIGPIGVIGGIIETIKQSKVKSSMEKNTKRNKPEFQFPSRAKQAKEENEWDGGTVLLSRKVI